MARLTRKTPTLAERLAEHEAAGRAAVAQFEKAAVALEDSAFELREAAAEAYAEAQALQDLASRATHAALGNEASAKKIRGMFNG